MASIVSVVSMIDMEASKKFMLLSIPDEHHSHQLQGRSWLEEGPMKIERVDHRGRSSALLTLLDQVESRSSGLETERLSQSPL